MGDNERRLMELPKQGDVVICHPIDEAHAQAAAERHGVGYFLTADVPAGTLSLVDVARHDDPIAWCARPTTVHEMG